NNRALNVIALQQVEDFFLRAFRMQVDYLLLLPGRGEKIFQHLYLCGILRVIFHPVKIQSDLTDRGTLLDERAPLAQTISVFRGPIGMDAERGQHKVTLSADFETAFI